MSEAKIGVLIVDDSFVMRKLVSDILNSDSDVEVIATARSGKEAIKKIPQIKPDVITLDLVMPGLDGLATLKQIMSQCPTPVIILSAHSKEGADITIKCLESGALSFVLKPSGELSLDIESVQEQLLREVKLAAKVNVAKLTTLIQEKPYPAKRRSTAADKIIIMGASTGGPQTLELIIGSLPPDLSIPVIIIQHMPAKEFTQSLAERLNNNCALEVKVAENNEIVKGGTAYLAPGGYRITFKLRRANETMICLKKEASDALTPSVDIAMQSIAKIYGQNALGVILTGMGHDGAEGMKAIKESGGRTIVQDESSLIFGMPKAVIDSGCADNILPVNKIAGEIVNLAV